MLSDAHEALLSADGRLCGPRRRVAAGSLDPGARHRALILDPRLLVLLGLVQSVADEQTLVGEVGQLGLPLRGRRTGGVLLTRSA